MVSAFSHIPESIRSRRGCSCERDETHDGTEKRSSVMGNSKRIPFFKREQYNGAREFVVISINPHRYGQARRVIDQIDSLYRRRLVLSNY